MQEFRNMPSQHEITLEYSSAKEIVLEYVQSCPEKHLSTGDTREAIPSKKKQKKRRRVWLWVFPAAVSLAAIIFAICMILPTLRSPSLPFQGNSTPSSQQEGKLTSIPTVSAEPGVKMQINRQHGQTLTAQEIYAQVNPATVTVVTSTSSGSGMIGTGVIFTSDGYVLTNFHVIEGGSACYAMLSTGRSYEARLVAYDDNSDIAILKLLNAQDLSTVDFGDSDALVVGDPAYAIGNPLGVDLRGTLTDGIISATSREVTSSGRTLSVLQTNAALNSGNSGGPLINQYGQVVGINTIKMSSTVSSGSVEGLGFALPSNSVFYVVNDLLTYGYSRGEPTFGMMVVSIADDLGNGEFGLQIKSVNQNSPAEKAGLQAGDYILSVDGQQVPTSSDLIRLRRTHGFGDSMHFSVWRNGQHLEVDLTL